MNVKTILMILLLLIMLPGKIDAHSHEEQHPLALNILTDDALQLVKKERYVEAYNLLDVFSDEFTKVMMQNRQIPMDEIRIISVVHDESIAAVGDVALPYEEKVRAVTRLRLVVDAMTSEHQPLWTELEEPIIMTFHQLKDSIETRDSSTYQELYRRLVLHYNMIHPSLRMDVKPTSIQKVDAHMEYLEQNRETLLAHSEQAEDLAVIEADLKALFKELKEDEADPSLLWVIISTGSFILLTLSYVGFRKYKGDKKREKWKKLKD